MAEEFDRPASSDDPGGDDRSPAGRDVAAPAAHAAPSASPADALAHFALATIRDVTDEVGRLAWRTATRLTDGTPAAPILRALLGAAPDARESDDPAATDGHPWIARVVDAEQALALAVQRATGLQDRHEATAAELRESREREKALQSELAATLERACAEREAISRRADEVVTTAESQRAALSREVEAARAAMAALQHASLAQRNELAIARSEIIQIRGTAAEATQERDAFATEAHATRQRLGEAQERLRVLEVELARVGELQRRAELATIGEHAEREARWQAELASLRLEHARERDSAQALGEELERMRVEAQARERREQRLQDELKALGARADSDREDTVRRAQEMVQAAEEARAAATAELEAVLAAQHADRTRLSQIETEQEQVEREYAERDAALASARATVAQLEGTRAALAAELERTRSRLSDTETELLAVQHEHGLGQRQLEKLCTAHDDIVEDHARASAFLNDARATEAGLRAQIDELREQVQTLEADRVRLLAMERQHDHLAEQDSKASALQVEITSLRAWTRTLENEVAQASAALEQASQRERRLQETLAAHDQSRREHDETLRQAQAIARTSEDDRAVLVAEMEALRLAMASAQRVILEAEEETRVARAEAERLAVSHEALLAEKARLEGALPSTAPAKTPEPQTLVPPTPMVIKTAPDTRVVAVLDATTQWPETAGAEVHVIEPCEDIVARIGDMQAGRCIVNLAAPGAIAAAVTLRTAGLSIPLWGALVTSNERGLSLGQIDVLVRPIDPELVRLQCVTIAPKSARLLAIGSDSTTFIALRQGLMKAGMSVSIAWDLKQATELLEIVRPQLIVLDLALPGRGAASLVAELARLEQPPVLVLLAATPEQVATFSNALPAFVPTDGARTPANILRAVIDAKRQGT